jgi:hypothetical protein
MFFECFSMTITIAEYYFNTICSKNQEHLLCLPDDAANGGEGKSRLLSDGAIGAPFIPQPKHQALFGVVGLGSATKFSARLPPMLNALQSPLTDE